MFVLTKLAVLCKSDGDEYVMSCLRKTAGKNSGEDAMKRRQLSISETRFRAQRVPFIRLAGQWLERLGFHAGEQILVEVEPGRVTLSAISTADLVDVERS
jgi:hypothetical protein